MNRIEKQQGFDDWWEKNNNAIYHNILTTPFNGNEYRYSVKREFQKCWLDSFKILREAEKGTATI